MIASWPGYLGNPAFRKINAALLGQGGSVHTLQREIYSGAIGAKHGRTPEQMAAISSSLTLLTNVINLECDPERGGSGAKAGVPSRPPPQAYRPQPAWLREVASIL